MEPNAFIGKLEQPSELELKTAIGATAGYWNQLLEDLDVEGLITSREWHSYSPKAGWSLRLKLKKRTILYMGPYSDGFRVALIFGEKALDAIRKSKFPVRILTLIDEAPKYAEGTGIRLDVKKAADLPIIKRLAAIKVAN